MPDLDKQAEKRHFINSLIVPFILVVLIILSFVLEKGMDWDFHKAGIFPRKPESLSGIFGVIFVHADWNHLLNNMLSLFILTTALYYFYSPIATRILFLSWILSGLILWIIGRDNWHIGASGLIYALAFFLFTSGILRRHGPLIAISLIVVFLYGSMIWYIFPIEYEKSISWEGHLSGLIVGVLLAVIYRKKGPQKPEKVWDDEEDDDEENEFSPQEDATDDC